MTAQRIYLDHHATTPVDPRAADVILRAMTEVFGNANSAEHAFGREAARWVDRAAAEVADLVGAQTEDVRFTSGASEALRLGLAYASERKGPGPLRVAASTIEHPALLSELERGVRKGWFEVSDLAVDDQGLVRFPAIEHRLAEGVDLICLMAANNEVGTLQPIEEAARLTQAAGSAILVDATQAAGRVTLSARASAIDYLILSGHKLYGPKGVGALVGPDLRVAPPPERYAFHQSTPNVPGIAGFGAACRLSRAEMAFDEARIGALRNRLQSRLLAALPGAVVNGATDRRLSGNLHISIGGVDNEAVVARVSDRVALSTGAACASGADAPSHVLRAMGLPEWRQQGALRMSLGRFTTESDVDRAAVALLEAVWDVRAFSEAS